MAVMTLPAVIATEPAPEAAPYTMRDLRGEVDAIVNRLESMASDRVARRQVIEQRWIEDLQDYHGVVPAAELTRIKALGGSEVTMNITAPKTDATAAWIANVLFPTDDRNWALKPTPIPEMGEKTRDVTEKLKLAKERADAAEAQMKQAAAAENPEAAAAFGEDMQAAQEDESALEYIVDEMRAVEADAAKRARMMEAAIDDALVESQWAAQARMAIEDACRIGFGVVKGPVREATAIKRWVRGDAGGWVMTEEEDPTPRVERVDPWAYFPDPDVSDVKDGEGDLQRHLWNAKQLRDFAKRDDIDADAVRDVLKTGPRADGAPRMMAKLHDLTDTIQTSLADRFDVWEFTGALEPEEVSALDRHATMMESGSAGILVDDMAPIESDPLAVQHVRMWFTQGRLLSYAPHPLDSGETIYSTFTLRRAENSVYGYGIPRIMRYARQVSDGGWRMLMDNGALSVGPQVVVNTSVVRPQDGDRTLRSRKVWIRDEAESAPGTPAFEVFNIPSNQAELSAIINMASDFADILTATPPITQGEAGAQVAQTFRGMAILANAANVVRGRTIKQFDDNVTGPMIRRLHSWLMQFGENDEMKGDAQVDVRGASHLLVREMQSTNMLAIADRFGDHPLYGPWLKHEELMAEVFRAHMVSPAEFVRSRAEHEAFLAQQSEADPTAQMAQMEMQFRQEELALRREELQAKVSISEMDAESRRAVAQLNFDAAMERAALNANDKDDDRAARVGIENARMDSSERRMAVEAATLERTGKSSGGAL